MSATRLGVDLGTTWTAAAVQRAGRVEPLRLGTDSAAMPSVVAIDGGNVIVGEAAEHQLLVDPASGIRESKRRLGDTAPMVMAGQPYGAEAVMGHVLRHVVDVATRNGGPVDEVVLTHPATWGEYKLDLLREAGRQAGIGAVGLLPEPSAAALHYVSLGRIAIGDIVAVYDFGGGTFDAAIVQCTEHGAVLLGPPEGLERLGGVDLDQMVLAHVNNALDGRLRELDSTDPEVRRALVQLRADCVAAKEALSNDTEATVPITVPGLNTQVRITRDEFESTLRARIIDTLGALDRAVVAAGVDQSALAGVLLVGGSSRIPVVGEEVARHTGRPVLIDADLKLVVALGAAGGSTVMAIPKKTETVDVPTTEAADTAAAPVPKAPTTAAAQAAQKAAALRAAAGTNEKKDGKEGGFINPTTVGLGVAAAGAVAAGYVATQMLGGDDADAAEDAPADEAVPVDAPLDGSLDAFDDGGGGGGGGGGRGIGGRGRGSDDDGPSYGGGGGSGPANAPYDPGSAPPPGSDAPGMPPLADISAARTELLERLAQWAPPEGADPEEVAAFRAELQGIVERFQPQPGQSANDALASLRQEFSDQVEDFVQDVKIDAVIEDRDNPEPAPPDRDGFDWVAGSRNDQGEYIPGHWERERADQPPVADDPPPSDVWVDGYYDDQGNYVKGHYDPAPPAPDTPTPPYTEPEPEPEPAPPYSTPVVRDHRGDDDGPVYSPRTPRDRDDRDDYSGANVRDHRAGAEPEESSVLRQLEDAFDDVLPVAAPVGSVPRMAPRAEEPDAQDAPDPLPSSAVTTSADDLLGVDAFASASATAPALNLVPEAPAVEPIAAMPEAIPVPELVPVAAGITAITDPIPGDPGLDMVPVSVDTATDFAEPDPTTTTTDPDTPSDLDNDPNTPL